MTEPIPDNWELANVVVTRTAQVATLTMNRPDTRNALSHGPNGMHADLERTLRAANQDTSVRCIVLRGTGGAFSSGGDLRTAPVREEPIDFYRFHEAEQRRNLMIRNMRMPVIASILGPCYGAGLIMAAHCDLRIVGESARLGLLETRFGNGGIEVFPSIIGVSWTKYLALTGEIMTAAQAVESGLALRCVPDEHLDECVAELARRVASLPPAGVEVNKRLIDAAQDQPGLMASQNVARSANAITDMMARTATAADGRRFRDILQTGDFAAFKAARDAAHVTPWWPDSE